MLGQLAGAELKDNGGVEAAKEATEKEKKKPNIILTSTSNGGRTRGPERRSV